MPKETQKCSKCGKPKTRLYKYTQEDQRTHNSIEVCQNIECKSYINQLKNWRK